MSVDTYVLLGPERFNTYERGRDQPTRRYHIEQCDAAIEILPETLVNLQVKKCRTSIYAFLYALIPEDGYNPRHNLKAMHLVFRDVPNADLGAPTEEICWKRNEQRAKESRSHVLNIATMPSIDEEFQGAE